MVDKKINHIKLEDSMDDVKPKNVAVGFVASVPFASGSQIRSNTFRSYTPSLNVKEQVFTMTNSNSEKSKRKLVWIGHESRLENMGCNYALAVVNKKSKTVNIMPTKFVTFDGHSDNWESVVGRKSIQITDFTANYTSLKEARAMDRRALTSEFGSSKGVKAMNRSEKRRVEDETLQHMVGSTLVDGADGLNKTLNELDHSLTMINPAKSAVLPEANMDATKPEDIYSLTTFLTYEAVESLLPKVSTFLQKKRDELLKCGVPHLVCNFLSQSKDEKESVYALFLGAMVACYRVIAAVRRHHLTHDEWMNIDYPLEIKRKVSQLYFSGTFKKETNRSKLSKVFFSCADKDKILAHILCLAIILDSKSYILPITPWSNELLTPESKIVRIATALGCTMISATPDEAVLLQTVRIAKLVRTPGDLKQGYRRNRRSK